MESGELRRMPVQWVTARLLVSGCLLLMACVAVLLFGGWR